MERRLTPSRSHPPRVKYATVGRPSNSCPDVTLSAAGDGDAPHCPHHLVRWGHTWWTAARREPGARPLRPLSMITIYYIDTAQTSHMFVIVVNAVLLSCEASSHHCDLTERCLPSAQKKMPPVAREHLRSPRATSCCATLLRPVSPSPPRHLPPAVCQSQLRSGLL